MTAPKKQKAPRKATGGRTGRSKDVAATPVPVAPVKRPVGRPTKYDPAYCDLVLEVMGTGLSLTAFAGHIRVSRDTLNDWMAAHPEFLQATREGQAMRTAYLERTLLSPDAGGPQVSARVFALKNAAPEEWRDKIVQEHTGPNGTGLVVHIKKFDD